MSYVTNILPVLVTELNALDVGKVNDRPRNSVYVETHKERFNDTEGVFRGVFIDRIAAPSTGALSNQILRNHQVDFFLYHVVNDETESANLFQAAIDTVLTRFDEVLEIATNIYQTGTPQLIEKIEIMFGGVLCHVGRIQITAQEETTP